jgi:hypothetical protein
MKPPTAWALALGLATVMLSAPALGVVIDDFKSGASATARRVVSHRRIGTLSATDPKLSGVIGGTRRITVTVTSLQVADLDTVTADILPGLGVLGYASSNGADGRVDLTYDAAGTGLKADLSKEKTLVVDVAEADAAAIPCVITVKLSDATGRTVESTQTLTAPGARQLQFPLSDFQSVNLRNVRSVALGINPERAGDLQLNQIRTVSAGGTRR